VSTNNSSGKPFSFRFIDGDSKVLLELMNVTDQTLRSVDILTIFLKDEETPGGGPSQAHIKFETIKCIQAQENLVLPHRTWINGRPVNNDHDQLERLKVIAGEPNPYVLDISWEDAEGKTRFQRIPVGH
jgi:hypothetical protein